MPEVEPTVAIPVSVLDHVPPAGAAPNVVVEPGHTLVVPEIADGNGLITTVALPDIVLVQVVAGLVAITV